jgi:hypothetical protein
MPLASSVRRFLRLQGFAGRDEAGAKALDLLTRSRTSNPWTTAPSRRAVAIAYKPATPALRAIILAGFTPPTAVVSISKRTSTTRAPSITAGTTGRPFRAREWCAAAAPGRGASVLARTRPSDVLVAATERNNQGSGLEARQVGRRTHAEDDTG